MNKIIHHLIKEMVKDLNLKESNGIKSDNQNPKYLSVRRVPGPSNKFNDPASDSRVKALSGEYLESDYGKDEIQLSIDDEYDRYSSLFQQLSNEPKKFNVGTNIVVNLNELDFSLENSKTIKLVRSAVKKQISGNAFLKVFGSFNKDVVAEPSVSNIQRSKSAQDRFLMDPQSTQGQAALPPKEAKASNEYENVIKDVNSHFQNSNLTNDTLYTASFKAVTGNQQVPANPHERMEEIIALNSNSTFIGALERLIKNTYVDENNNIFFKTVVLLNNNKNAINMPDKNRYNTHLFTNHNEFNIIYSEVRVAISNSIKAKEIADKYKDFFGSIKTDKKIFSPIILLQQSKKKNLSVSDAMLPFAHAAKDKVTSDVNVESDFDEKIIELNVNQFSNIISDFRPEVVIIPGSSSAFNTKYYNKIEALLKQNGIPMKSYSTYKSTHIISFDEDEARRDIISQQTRRGYAEGFWNANSKGRLKYFINNIHNGGNKPAIKNYTKFVGTTSIQVKTDTVFEMLISKSTVFNSVKSFLKGINSSGSNISFSTVDGLTITTKKGGKKTNVSIKINNEDNFLDDSNAYFTNNPDLETARIDLIKEIKSEVKYFEKNGVTNVAAKLLRQISGKGGPGSPGYSASVQSIREERLKRMLALTINSKYVIDKKTKKSKTLSEMGVVKISEIGSLTQGNQTKRVFLKDMHEVLDDAKLPKSLRPLVLDYLNTFASIVYDQMIGEVIDKSSVVGRLTAQMRQSVLAYTKNTTVNDQTPLFDIILGVGSVDSFELLNPSFNQIKANLQNAYKNLTPPEQQALQPLYDFIITDFFQSISNLQNAVNLSNSSFEDFVEIYKRQIFSLITARGSDFSSSMIDDITDLNSALMSQLQEKFLKVQDISFAMDDQEGSVASKFRESVKDEYESIYKIAEEKAKAKNLDQFSDFNEIISAFLDEGDNTEDLVASAVYSRIIESISDNELGGDLKDALDELYMLGESEDLEALLELYQEDEQGKDVLKKASSAAVSFLDDIESKKTDMFNSQNYRHNEIMASMESSGFIVKCVAVILNTFVEQAFKDYVIDAQNGASPFSEDLANLIQNNSNFKETINANLKTNCIHEVNVNYRGTSAKLNIVPKIDIVNGFLIFSANSLQATTDGFSFKINFNFIEFLEKEENYKKLKELAAEVSKEFIEKGIGFNRPKNILLLDDNVSSGGTFGLIAKNILKMQSDNNCYFSFENIDTSLTSFVGDIESFNFKDVTSVENSTNKVLTHIIGLTPIFI